MKHKFGERLRQGMRRCTYWPSWLRPVKVLTVVGGLLILRTRCFKGYAPELRTSEGIRLTGFLEQALTEYMDKLDAMPDGTLVTLNAAKFDPSPEDHELMESMPRLRNSGKRKRRPRKRQAKTPREMKSA